MLSPRSSVFRRFAGLVRLTRAGEGQVVGGVSGRQNAGPALQIADCDYVLHSGRIILPVRAPGTDP
jgi:hypothetical protein